MRNVYIIKTFASGNLLVAIDYTNIRIVTRAQYERIKTFIK